MQNHSEDGIVRVRDKFGGTIEYTEYQVKEMSWRLADDLGFYLAGKFDDIDNYSDLHLLCMVIKGNYDSTEAEKCFLAQADTLIQALMEPDRIDDLKLLLQSGRVVRELDQAILERLAAYCESDVSLRKLFHKVMDLSEVTEPKTMREYEMMRFYLEGNYYCINSAERIHLLCMLLNSSYDTTEAENYFLANAESLLNRLMEDGNTNDLSLLFKSGKVIGELSDELYDMLASYSECEMTLKVLFSKVMRIPESPEPFLIWDNVLVRCNDRNLTEADIPEEVTVILDSAFENCKKLKKVWLPDKLEIIGNRAFCGCRALETVLPGSLWLIENQKQVILPESVHFIGITAFYNCLHLPSVELPDCAVFVGENAFGDCPRITEFTISDKAKLGKHVIDVWNSLEHVTVRRASGDYVIELEARERCEWNNSIDDLLPVMVNRDFSDLLPFYFKKIKYLICSMLICNDDDGQTVDYVLSDKQKDNFYLLLNRLEPELMNRLLGCGKLTAFPLSRLYSELLDYTIETQSHDLQIRLMNAAEKEKQSFDERFKL